MSALLGRLALTTLRPMLGRVAPSVAGAFGKSSITKPLLSKGLPTGQFATGAYKFKPFNAPQGLSANTLIDKARVAVSSKFAKPPVAPTTSGVGVGGSVPTASPAMAGITPTTQMGTPAQGGSLLRDVGVGLGTMFAFNALFGG